MFVTESFNRQLDDLLERICSKLQISSAQHRLAQDRYETIGNWLGARESPLAMFNPVIYPQGSLRIGTTVRPCSGQEYDLDLVCEVQLDWRQVERPVAVLDAVEQRLKKYDTYKTMLERKKRCIRVNYANEFHLDILPACPDPSSGTTCVVVPDRDVRGWKPSNPKGYAAWFESRAKTFEVYLAEHQEPLPSQEPVEMKAPLKRVVQLIKRWRDLKYADDQKIAPISIVLTTLAAEHYGGQQSTSEALAGILAGIVASIPPRNQRLLVLNPKNTKEDLSEKWDENPDAYEAFVSGIIAFHQSWQDIARGRGIPSVSATLRDLFGEDLTKSVVKEQAESIQKARSEQRLHMQKSTGILSGLTTAGSVSVRSNTFYGSQEVLP
ncbi:nucleotidyltransferase [Candidatus Methylomirabilis sp.]|uniref:nucleotidyltransferase domain-containing protein n=1 Tax=Candidatus Methylomirabilis sp. TaxID=2032687 RepID=UPI003076676B